MEDFEDSVGVEMVATGSTGSAAVVARTRILANTTAQQQIPNSTIDLKTMVFRELKVQT